MRGDKCGRWGDVRLATDLERCGAILQGDGHLCDTGKTRTLSMYKYIIYSNRQEVGSFLSRDLPPENGNVLAFGRPPPSEIIPGTCHGTAGAGERAASRLLKRRGSSPRAVVAVLESQRVSVSEPCGADASICE